MLRPLSTAERIRLIVEVIVTDALIRLLMRRRPLPEVLRRLRRRAGRTQSTMPASRLAAIVERVLRLVPGDTRCLGRSLVLLAMLERRGITTTLVIGAATDDGFSAHAWIERDGQPLLSSGGERFGRLAEL